MEGKPAIEKANVGMLLKEKQSPGINLTLSKHKLNAVNSAITPVIPLKNAMLWDSYNQLTLDFRGNIRLVFRVYDDGMAYRFETWKQDSIFVNDELLTLNFPQETKAWFSRERSMYSHFEQKFDYSRLDTIATGSFSATPLLLKTPDDIKVWISETGQHDYPALFLEASGDNTLKGIFPKYVLDTEPNHKRWPDRNEIIIKEAEYIAKTNGQRSFPWRVFIIANDDRMLASSEMVYRLSPPQAIQNTSWIKPGRVAWDWYNANNIFGVDFKSGLNTRTYEYYIDFASDYGLEYVILDEGWTKSTSEILDFNPDIDVPFLIDYARRKNVGIILWVLWKPMVADLNRILDTYASWGAAGIKVDFMQRADQSMVTSYELIAAEAAKRNLLVDFHGSFKPNGLHRQYPNVLSYEGVRGNEHNKWSRDITPEHNVTLPFTRMLAGPMDYTPGALRNSEKGSFSISFERPVSQGTRCHQVAMYVVFESPLQMLCESPSAYRKEHETTKFIAQIPTTWDETIVLHASIGEYIVVARRNGSRWFVGAMTNWQERSFNIDLSFLQKGTYRVEQMKDGTNAHRMAEDYKYEIIILDSGKPLVINLAPGGGWAAIISNE